MLAAQINSYGDSKVISLNDDAPEPKPSEGQVLVEVYAAALNPIDNAIMAGYLKDRVPLDFPVTLGGDLSGVIIRKGEGVSDFKEGDKVYGQAILLNGGSGSLAQFTVANITNIAHQPKSIGTDEAASLPLAGVSALQGLEENIKLKKGQKILIHGGAGGIGSIAVQIARHLGAYTAATVSKDDKDYVKKLGADEVIDYKNEEFEEILKDYDAVLDTVGGETTEKSFRVLKKGGILVSLVTSHVAEVAKKYDVSAIYQLTNTKTEFLNRLSKLVDEGVVKVQVDKVFPLTQSDEAFKHLTEGHPRGKVVVRVKD
jgi:NADPH:quinone reductase-like Zn-dependent oxidoreductase